jgi:hypothetical protein
MVSLIFCITSCFQYSPDNNQSQATDALNGPVLSESQVLPIVWEALEPNTSSHDRLNWLVADIYTSKGIDVIERFRGEPTTGCWYGPKPPENGDIRTDKLYWYVFMKPVPATPLPSKETPSPTGPPNVPEPFLKEAYFLVDPVFGNVVARKLICVIY